MQERHVFNVHYSNKIFLFWHKRQICLSWSRKIILGVYRCSYLNVYMYSNIGELAFEVFINFFVGSFVGFIVWILCSCCPLIIFCNFPFPLPSPWIHFSSFHFWSYYPAPHSSDSLYMWCSYSRYLWNREETCSVSRKHCYDIMHYIIGHVRKLFARTGGSPVPRRMYITLWFLCESHAFYRRMLPLHSHPRITRYDVTQFSKIRLMSRLHFSHMLFVHLIISSKTIGKRGIVKSKYAKWAKYVCVGS